MAYSKTDYKYCDLAKLSSLFEALLKFMKKTPGRDFSGINKLILKIKKEIRQAGEWGQGVKLQEVKSANQSAEFLRKEVQLKHVIDSQNKEVKSLKKELAEREKKVTALEELFFRRMKDESLEHINPEKTVEKEKKRLFVTSRGQLETTSMKVDTALQLRAMQHTKDNNLTPNGKIRTLKETLGRKNIELAGNKMKCKCLEINLRQLKDEDEMEIERLKKDLQLCHEELMKLKNETDGNYSYFSSSCANVDLKRTIMSQNEIIQDQENEIQFIKDKKISQLSEKDEHIERLKDKLREKERIINEQSDELTRASFEEKLDKMKNKTRIENYVRTMKENLEEVTKQREILKQKLKHCQTTETKLTGIKCTLEDKNLRLLLEMGGLKRTINDLENEKDNLLSQNNDELKRASEILKETDAKLDGSEQNLQCLEDDKRRLELGIKLLGERLHKTESESKFNALQKQKLEVIVKELSREKCELDTVLKELRENKVRLVDTLTFLQQDNKAKDHEISQLYKRDQMISKSTEIKEAEVREISLRELQQNKDECCKTIRSLEHKNQCLMTNLQDSDLQIKHLEGRLAKGVETTTKYEKQNQDKDDEITELQNRMKNTTKLLDDKTLRLDKLTKITEEFREKEQEYINSLDAMNNELQQAAHNLQETKSKSDEEIKLQTAKAEALMKDIMHRDLQLNNLKDKIDNEKTKYNVQNGQTVVAMNEKNFKLSETVSKLQKQEKELESFAKQMQVRDNQISELRSRLRQAVETINHKDEDIDGYTSLKKEFKRLETELMQNEQSIEYLRKTIKSKTDALAEINDSKSHLEKDLKSQLNHYKDKMQKTIENLQRDIKDRDVQMRNLEENLAQSAEIKSKYENENQEKDDEINELRNRLKNASKLLDDKTLRLDQLKKRTELIEDKEQEYINSLHTKNNELQQDLQKTKSKSDEEIKLLKTKIEALEKDIMHRESDLNDLKEKINKEKTNYNVQNDQTVVAMNEKDFKLSETVSKLQKQEEELESFAKQIQERDNHISELRSRLRQALETIDDNEKSIEGYTSLKKECKRLKAELMQYEQNIEHLQKTIKSKMDALNEINDSKRHLEKDLKSQFNHQQDQMQQEIKNLQRDIKNRDLQLNNLEVLLTKSDETKSKYENKNQEKENEIIELRNRMKNTSKLLDDKTHRLDQLSKRIEALEENEHDYINSLHAKNNELQQAAQKLQETKSDSDEVIQLLKTRTEALEKDIMYRDTNLNDLKDKIDKEKTKYNVQKDRTVVAMNKKDLELSETVSKLQKQEKELESFAKQIQKRDDQISELRSRLRQALETINHKEEGVHGYTSLKKECKRLEAELIQYKQNIEHLQETIKTKTDALAEINDSNRHLEKDLKDRFNHQKDQMQQEIENLQRDIENRDLKIKALEKRFRGKTDTEEGDQSDYKRHTETKLSELKAELQRALSKLQTTETELDETKTRLSKAMGERLTDNNPNITDLSDRNRPTKLAERCAELYDNQWTDAFDIFDKHFSTERDVINALLQILQDAYSFCKTTADEQMTRIADELVLERQHEDGDVSTDVHSLKQLKDCRKVIANVAVGNLFKMYVSHHKRSTDEIFRTAIIELIPYSKECLEMCWFMVIQDPPVVFAPLLSRGSQFNTDMYRPYTTSGTHVEYVVWPPLLLHDGGPLLAKGVAQGYGKKSKMSTYT